MHVSQLENGPAKKTQAGPVCRCPLDFCAFTRGIHKEQKRVADRWTPVCGPSGVDAQKSPLPILCQSYGPPPPVQMPRLVRSKQSHGTFYRLIHFKSRKLYPYGHFKWDRPCGVHGQADGGGKRGGIEERGAGRSYNGRGGGNDTVNRNLILDGRPPYLYNQPVFESRIRARRPASALADP